MSDGGKLGEWAIGCQQAREIRRGLLLGHSNLSGGPLYVRIKADSARLLVTYQAGETPGRLAPRVMARILGAPFVANEKTTCLLSLMAWRTADMDEARWRAIIRAHEQEVLIIRQRLEGETAPLSP
jgi:hypothetical protein